jgi:hypothetical protein
LKLILKLLFVSIGLVITYIAIVWFQLKNPTTYHGTCEDPQENIVWFYQSDTPLFPFGHDYCGYCDTSVSEDNLLEWATNIDARMPVIFSPNQKVTSEHMTPCIYARGDNSDLCKENVCGENPRYNDIVGRDHGLWKSIQPRVFPDGPQYVPTEYGMNN